MARKQQATGSKECTNCFQTFPATIEYFFRRNDEWGNSYSKPKLKAVCRCCNTEINTNCKRARRQRKMGINEPYHG